MSNKSRFKNSYTDFPLSQISPAFPTAAQVQDYLKAYADRFDLLSHTHLRTKVLRITHNHGDTQWTLDLQERKTVRDYHRLQPGGRLQLRMGKAKDTIICWQLLIQRRGHPLPSI
jgi:cation diffusion facilitator CzcD-associated flavoprotein CzcO